MAKILKVLCYYKAPFIWQETEYKPSLKKEDRMIYFVFPDEEKYRQAINKYLAGGPCSNLKDYIARFKVLRGEMQVMKNQARTEDKD